MCGRRLRLVAFLYALAVCIRGAGFGRLLLRLGIGLRRSALIYGCILLRFGIHVFDRVGDIFIALVCLYDGNALPIVRFRDRLLRGGRFFGGGSLLRCGICGRACGNFLDLFVSVCRRSFFVIGFEVDIVVRQVARRAHSRGRLFQKGKVYCGGRRIAEIIILFGDQTVDHGTGIFPFRKVLLDNFFALIGYLKVFSAPAVGYASPIRGNKILTFQPF